MSIEMLQRNDPNDINVAYYLTCLPGGVKEPQLRKIMKCDEVMQSLIRLDQLSFLEKSIEKY